MEQKQIIRDEKGRFIVGTKEKDRKDVWGNSNEIIRLYQQELMNPHEISKLFKCSQTPIWDILKENNAITGFSKRKQILFNNHKIKAGNKIEFNKEEINEIIRLYQEELMNPTEIGKVFNCCNVTIFRLLKKNNILLNGSERMRKLFGSGKIKDWCSGLTKETDERLKRMGTKSSIRNKGNIPPNKNIEVWNKSEEIISMYLDKLMNTKEIAKIIGCDYWIIKSILKKNKVNIGQQERMRILYKKGKIKVWNDNLTKETDLRLKNSSEKLMGKKRPELSGENHWNWNNGSSFNPYPITFNKFFKLAIKQRDGFMCLKCGMLEEDHIKLFGRRQVIHHIDYLYENTFPENCCVLCNRCNLEVNANRKSWKKFFQSMLSERYGYQYSEDEKIILNLNQLNKIGEKNV